MAPAIYAGCMDTRERFRNIGGTRGGTASFLLGLAFVAAGGFLLLDHVRVSGGFWDMLGLGTATFGYTLIPLCIGIGFLFFDAKSPIGWILTGLSAVFILVGIIVSMHISLMYTSLFALIVMLTLLFGGLGLIARSLRAGRARREE